MNPNILSARLERVAAQVPAGARLADIGSDHAYLPVALLRRGAIEAAVAGEVAMTPYRAAQRSVRENELEERVSVRLASGLAAIHAQDAITAISLCGMGGETIRDILESDKALLTGQERLILQPNGGERPLRLWLMENGYRILHEEILRENRFYYEIIVAERSGAVVYTPQELYFGPWLLHSRSPAFIAKWQRLLQLKRRALDRMAHAQQVALQQKRRETLRQVRWIDALLESSIHVATNGE